MQEGEKGGTTPERFINIATAVTMVSRSPFNCELRKINKEIVVGARGEKGRGVAQRAVLAKFIEIYPTCRREGEEVR